MSWYIMHNFWTAVWSPFSKPDSLCLQNSALGSKYVLDNPKHAGLPVWEAEVPTECETKACGKLSKYLSVVLRGQIFNIFHLQIFSQYHKRQGWRKYWVFPSPSHCTETRPALPDATLLVSQHQWPGNCSFPWGWWRHITQMWWGEMEVQENSEIFFPEDIHLAKGGGCQVLAFGVFLLDLFLF